MTPTNFPDSNIILTAPEGLEEVVMPIPAQKLKVNGIDAVLTCWEPNEQEIDEIRETGKVWLLVLGQTMPPVCVTGVQPIE